MVTGRADDRVCLESIAVRATVLLLLVLAVVGCVSDPLAEAGVACDPMVYVAKVSSSEEDIWITGEGQAARLTEPDVVYVNPAISPDGLRIAFTSGPGDQENLDLVLMNTDGSNRMIVWAGDTIQSSVDWSPDGETLVFDQFGPDHALQIYTIPSDGSSQPTQLTAGKPNGKPIYSPDGDSILFLSLRDGESQEIYSMTSAGADPVNLTHSPSRDVLAEMSPDGSQIAFASDRTGDFEIWLMDADGSDPIRLTSNPGDDSNPTWSSDGNHILFTSELEPVGIWAVQRDGSNPVPIVKNGWAPDCP